MLESQSRALKTQIIVSKKNSSETIGSLDWRPGLCKLGQKNENDTPTCDVLPQRTTNPKQKIFFHSQIFFSISTSRLAESIDGLNSFLAQSPGKL